jgi:hypothetical protein
MEKPLISGFVEKQREDKTWAWRGKATEPTIGQPGLRLMKNSYRIHINHALWKFELWRNFFIGVDFHIQLQW